MDIYHETICVNVYPKKGKISLQTYFDFAGFKTEKHNDWFTAKGTVKDFMEFCQWSLEHITNHLSGCVLNVQVFHGMVESMSIENADSILNKRVVFSKIYCGKVKGNGIYCDNGDPLFLFDKDFSNFFELEDSNVFVIYQMPQMTVHDPKDFNIPVWTTLSNSHNSLDVYSPNKFTTAGYVKDASILEDVAFFIDVYLNLKDLSCNDICEKLNINLENKELYKNLMKRYSNINGL